MRIVIVDDDSLVGLSLKTILEATSGYEVVALGKDGTEAIELYDKHGPDILLMDIQMKEMNGLDAASVILKNHPDARILLLTTFSDDEYIVKALRIGAKGYILKQNFDSILPAISAVCNGQTVFGDEIMNKIPSLISSEATTTSYKDFDLSEKEFNIIKLVADGLNNKEIAESLFLGEGTVRNYISTILEKLDLRDRTQLAVFYYKNF
ncbi:MAG: response regulator transcription factor [Lachnospiraceae bacterium]|nr:response regulator transcription factor [Lachnospiraceae bacterium]